MVLEQFASLDVEILSLTQVRIPNCQSMSNLLQPFAAHPLCQIQLSVRIMTVADSMMQMLRFGRHAVYDRGLILKSARMIQREVRSDNLLSARVELATRHVADSKLCGNMQLPKRLARRLMDLQFLPHIVVTNPFIKRVSSLDPHLTLTICFSYRPLDSYHARLLHDRQDYLPFAQPQLHKDAVCTCKN